MTALRILIVDDDESIRDFISAALEDEGYEIVTALHGAAALEIIAHSPPSLILLDLRMPVMDGWTFARVYRERPRPHIPIVVLTAAQDAAENAQQADADGYLAKPFGLIELLTLVSHYTQQP